MKGRGGKGREGGGGQGKGSGRGKEVVNRKEGGGEERGIADGQPQRRRQGSDSIAGTNEGRKSVP